MTVQTTFGFWCMLAALCLTVPIPWAGAFLLSSVAHELGHIFAMKWMGIRIHRLLLRADGAYLEAGEMTPKQELVCALAGPLGGLAVVLLARWFPRTAVCAVVQTCFNALPVYPFDGGRALRSLTGFWIPEYTEKICVFAELLAAALIAGVGLYLSVGIGMGWLPLIVSAGMIFRIRKEKYLANRAWKGYNIPTN